MVMETSNAGGSGAALSSSIAVLLQERFRQLERMKELRQEKEVLRMLSESAETSSYSSHNSPPPPTVSHHHHHHHHHHNHRVSAGPDDEELVKLLLLPRPNKMQLSLSLSLSLSLWPAADYPENRLPVGSRGTSPPNLPRSRSRSDWFTDELLLCSNSASKNGNSAGSDVDTSLHL